MGMDMNQLFQQVGQMQEQMQKAQAELANETVEATAGGGMVTVIANGAGEIRQIKIDPKAIDPNDAEMLEDMILAAVNEAVRSAQALMESKLGGRALLGDDIERTARMRAETDVRCLAISRPELERLLAEDPRVAERLRRLSS